MIMEISLILIMATVCFYIVHVLTEKLLFSNKYSLRP